MSNAVALLEGVVGKPVGVRVPDPDSHGLGPSRSRTKIAPRDSLLVVCSVGHRAGSEEKRDFVEPVSPSPRRAAGGEIAGGSSVESPLPTPQAGDLIIELTPYPFGLSTQSLVVTSLVGLSLQYEFPVVFQTIGGEAS